MGWLQCEGAHGVKDEMRGVECGESYCEAERMERMSKGRLTMQGG